MRRKEKKENGHVLVVFRLSTLYFTAVDWSLTTQIRQWVRNLFLVEQAFVYPGYQRFFSRAAGIFGVGRRPKPRGLYKDLTETGHRTRTVSGTQGSVCGERQAPLKTPVWEGIIMVTILETLV